MKNVSCWLDARKAIAFVAVGVFVNLIGPGLGHAAFTADVAAFDNATVQPGGPRTGSQGKSFLNVEGSNNGSFASFGVIDFSAASFGLTETVGSISQLNLSLTQSNAGFTNSGGLNFWITTDITSSIQPGGGLFFDASDNPDGIGSQLNTRYLLGAGFFTEVASGQTDTFSFSSFDPDLEAILISALNSGDNLRIIVSPTDAATAATWAGVGGSFQGPMLNFEYAAIPEPSTYALIGLGLAGLIVLRRMKKTPKV